MMTTVVKPQSLTSRQQYLGTIAALEALGDMERLNSALKNALDGGLTINEIKEVFSHLYAYTGFPRSLNALNELKKVLQSNCDAEWKEGKLWVRPLVWENAQQAYELGVKNQTLMAGSAFTYDFCPQSDFYLKSHLFGDIFASNLLSAADRELVTVAALSALKGVAPQLMVHKAGAVRIGNTPKQVEDLCKYLSENGLSEYDNASIACAGDWMKGNLNSSYAPYFTGNSYLASLVPKNLSKSEESILPLCNVTFEPGCRNNWHIHHGAHQILICVSGQGWYQEWGKTAIPLKAGDIIDIPDEIKHWHGARKDSWFQHLTAHVEIENAHSCSVSNEWLEPVNEEDYNKLK